MKRENAPFPSAPFALLLVEGGDEHALFKACAGSLWTRFTCWVASNNQGVFRLAQLAAMDPNAARIGSIGVVLDAEEDPAKALEQATSALSLFPTVPVRLKLILPSSSHRGSVETLVRRAYRDLKTAECTDAFMHCVSAEFSTQALRDKAWVHAYLACSEPKLRWHQAFDAATAPHGFDLSHASLAPLFELVQALAGVIPGA
ncbi:MAG: hypothetical protein JST92_04850 [Deltaproteobacteria bacterium]|nr:hypothetical protein [Deltaproteobacteria bacterium]